jgi:hypothetical protein
MDQSFRFSDHNLFYRENSLVTREESIDAWTYLRNEKIRVGRTTEFLTIETYQQ